MKVRVYFNLHRHLWSIQHYIPGKGWRILDHSERVLLQDVTWKVYEAGRQRVIKQKRKNVHAFGIGTLIGTATTPTLDEGYHRISYNPYAAGAFTSAAPLSMHVLASDFAYFAPDRKSYFK